MAEEHVLVAKDQLHAFVVRCMCACQVTKDHAESLADLIVAADCRGHYSHGVTRLYMYVEAVKGGGMAKGGSPKVLKETVATALVDAQNLIGPVVGKFCMDLAIEKAKSAGIGWVSARDCTHFGIAGYYGQRATEQGMLGMAFTNTIPILAPTRAKQAVFGTNPLCVAAPANNGDNFVLDMATTTVAYGKVVVADKKDQDIPKGWALNKDGQSVTNPKEAKLLSPLGGEEKTLHYHTVQPDKDKEPEVEAILKISTYIKGLVQNYAGYKGYGLAMMVDIFSGVLSGSNYGPHVPDWRATKQAPSLGQCFVAINPDAFADGFTDRMSDLIDYCRNLEPVDGADAVLVAGDKEKQQMERCNKQCGIYYHPSQIKVVNELAVSLNVEPLQPEKN